jgi:pimeloyl-ACP methyl ester carboxylesterase/DNA-binding CsgD family transcriptional regulator
LQQTIRFATARDGTRLAYAVHGHGAPLVRAAHWLTHLQYDWESPVWQPWLAELGGRFSMLRYDERGCGLSDWQTERFSLDTWVEDLETVVDAAGLERFALFGMSQGAAVAIAYTARHPGRVSGLVILGGYLVGGMHRGLSELERQERDALMTLMRIAWGRDNPTFRRLYTLDFVPDADEQRLRAYDELQRRTTSPENAARFQRAFSEIDVRSAAPHVRVPTLVMHLDDDRAVDFASGRQVAAAIPGARFVQLPGRNHIIQADDAAWPLFLSTLEDFLAPNEPMRTPRPDVTQPLSERELQVARLVAHGLTNQEIGERLGLSVRTVERHLSNIYLKQGVAGTAARAAIAARVTQLDAGGRQPA